MKINDLRNGLSIAAELLGIHHPQSAGDQLRQFASALQSAKPIKTTEAVDKILAKWSISSRRAAFPAPLRDTIAKLAVAQAAFGASAAAVDLNDLLRLFEGSPDRSASDFCLDIVDGLIIPAKQPAAKKARAAAPKALPASSMEINSIADQLVALADDHEAFDRLLATLAADKRITKPVLAGITNRFLGYDAKPKSKGAALETIRRRQMQDAIQGARAREVQKLAV